MIKALFVGVAAAEVCQSSMEEMGIGYDECMAIQTEFNAMVESGKSIDELETDLNQCHHDTPMDCADCNGDSECHGTCMEIKNNGACQVEAPGCARQVAYGGYVKSHVLIQCYGMIDEGCRRLKTKYMPVQVKTNAAAMGGDAANVDKMPSCKELCNAGCSGDSGCCDVTCKQPSLQGVDCSMGSDCQDWTTSCMKSNFKRYLHCVGRRVAKCYRQKWIVSKECINAAPTQWGGCTKSWNQEYDCSKGDHGCTCNNHGCIIQA